MATVSTTRLDSYIQEYNDCVDHLQRYENVSFEMCERNSLVSAHVLYLRTDFADTMFFGNAYLTAAYRLKKSYNCCLVYDDIDKHLCESFPVLVGSTLDKQIATMAADKASSASPSSKPSSSPLYDLFFRANQTSRMYKKCRGYLLVGGRFCWLPYLLTNNRALFHRISNKSILRRTATRKQQLCVGSGRGVKNWPLPTQPGRRAAADSYVRYMYDTCGKGHLIKYEFLDNKSVQFVYRNAKAREYVNKITPISLGHLERTKVCWNRRIMLEIATSLDTVVRKIDDLSNKLIISPAMLLVRYVNACKVQSNNVNIIYNGGWYKLISSTGENANTGKGYKTYRMGGGRVKRHVKSFVYEKFAKNKVRKVPVTASEISNIYRKPLVHQLGKQAFFAQVVRVNSRQFAKNHIAPNQYLGYLCPLEKSTSIDSFNRNYSLVDDVHVPHLSVLRRLDGLNELFDCLLQERLIRRLTVGGGGNNSDEDGGYTKHGVRDDFHFVTVNGGHPTTFYALLADDGTTSRGDFFLRVKSINPWVEVSFGKRVIVFNLIEGIPFKETKLLDVTTTIVYNICLSPHETQQLDHVFGGQYVIDYERYKIFGPQCLDFGGKHLRFLEYAKLNKLMHAINYLKHRISGVESLPLAIFSAETVAIFIDNGHDGNNEYVNNVLPSSPSSPPRINSDKSIRLSNMFAVDPRCTQDGYLAQAEHIPNFVIYRYCGIDVEFDTATYRYVPASADAVASGDDNAVGEIIYIGKIQNRRDKLKVWKNLKFSTTTESTGNGNYEHSLFIPLADLEQAERIYNFHHLPIEYMYGDGSGGGSTMVLSIEVAIVYGMRNGYDGLKFCNAESQKGLVNAHVDLARRYRRPSPPSLVSSACTLIGRTPVAQLLKSNPRVVADMMATSGNDNDVDHRFTDMAVLRNIATDHKNLNLMRLDNLTLNMLDLNDCSVARFTYLQNAYGDDERGKFLPKKNSNLLRLLLVLKKNIIFNSALDPHRTATLLDLLHQRHNNMVL